MRALFELLIESWQSLVAEVAAEYPSSYDVPGDEKWLVRRFREAASLGNEEGLIVRDEGIDPVTLEDEDRSRRAYLDLECTCGGEVVAVEVKFKKKYYGAEPDNRAEAFWDIHKLEGCVRSGRYSQGIFLWLTDNEVYLKEPKGSSPSTANGRRYNQGTRIKLIRAPHGRDIPLTFELSGSYHFRWESVPNSSWFYLVIPVQRNKLSIPKEQ